MKRKVTVAWALVLFAASSACAEPPWDFAQLHQLIRPSADDSQWLKVAWMPATDIWAARQKAAHEGKPILLWYMAGEPLGPC